MSEFFEKPGLDVELLLAWSVLPAGDAVDVPAILRVRGRGRGRRDGDRPLHLVLAIDRSASLVGEGMELLRSAAMALVKELGAEDHLSVVAFGSAVERLVTAAGEGGRAVALEALGTLRAKGGTNLYGGLREAIDVAASTDLGERGARILLVGDGEATVGERRREAFAELVRGARRAGVTLSTIGLGPDYDEVLMAEIAALGGGWHHFVGTGRDLLPVLERELRRGRATVADGVTVELEAPAGLSWSLADDVVGEAEGRRCRCHLGAVGPGGQRDLRLRLHLPRRSAQGTVLLAGRCLWRGEGGSPGLRPFEARITTGGDATARERGRNLEVERVWDEMETAIGFRRRVDDFRSGRLDAGELATWIDERRSRLLRWELSPMARRLAQVHRTLVEEGGLDPLLSKHTMVEGTRLEAAVESRPGDDDEGGST